MAFGLRLDWKGPRSFNRRGGRGCAVTILAALLTTASGLASPTGAAQTLPLVGEPQAPPAEDTFRGDEIVIGSNAAPVTIVEYLSVTCVHCAAFERETWPQAQRALVDRGRVRFIIREMPTAPVAVAAAGFLMARCRGATAYWPVVERLLHDQARVLEAQSTEEALRAEAAIAGLSEPEMRLCLSDPASVDAINARRQAGLTAGIDSTPFFLINGAPLKPGKRLADEPYAGGELTYRQLAAAVAQALPNLSLDVP